MANNLEIGQAELTNLIMEMIEGESPERLQEIKQLLFYHMGYHAGMFSGEETFEQIVCSPPCE